MMTIRVREVLWSDATQRVRVQHLQSLVIRTSHLKQ